MSLLWLIQRFFLLVKSPGDSSDASALDGRRELGSGGSHFNVEFRPSLPAEGRGGRSEARRIPDKENKIYGVGLTAAQTPAQLSDVQPERWRGDLLRTRTDSVDSRRRSPARSRA